VFPTTISDEYGEELVSAFIKLRRAERFRDEANQSAHAYSRRLDVCEARIVESLGGTEHVMYETHITHKPLETAAILGDFIGNLHEALDHLAWALLPTDEHRSGNRHTQFPILGSDPATDRATAQRWLSATWRMTEPAKAFIERHQPYYLGAEPACAATAKRLGVLQRLSNHDKHRTLTKLEYRIAVQASYSYLRSDGIHAGNQFAGVPTTHFGDKSYCNGEIISPDNFHPSISEPDSDVEFFSAVEVLIDDKDLSNDWIAAQTTELVNAVIHILNTALTSWEAIKPLD